MNFSKERALTRVIVLSCCTFMAVMGCESSEPAKTESTSIIALKDGPSAPSVLDQVVDELRWRESIKWPPKKPPNEGLTDEYWKWRINRQEELGLEDPWTEEQVCKRMDKHRYSLKELGFFAAKDGIRSGRVLVCGYILKPPFVLECKPCNAEAFGEKWVGRRLFVNGVVLASSCQDDDCGRRRPKEAIEGLPAWKRTECEARFDRKENEILDRMKALPADVDPDLVEKMMKSAASEFEKLSCPKDTPAIEFIGIQKVMKANPKSDYVILKRSDGIELGVGVPYPYNREDFKPRTPQQAERGSEKNCRIQLINTKHMLEEGHLVYRISSSPVFMKPSYEKKIIKILRSDLDILTKWHKLKPFGVCPECLMANNKEEGAK